MKQDVHPEYLLCNVTCSCGNTFTTRSVKSEMHVELCNQCHPFYTGKQKLVDTGGRVERFQKKYAKQREAAKAAVEASAGSAEPLVTPPVPEAEADSKAEPLVVPPEPETEAGSTADAKADAKADS